MLGLIDQMVAEFGQTVSVEGGFEYFCHENLGVVEVEAFVVFAICQDFIEAVEEVGTFAFLQAEFEIVDSVF